MYKKYIATALSVPLLVFCHDSMTDLELYESRKQTNNFGLKDDKCQTKRNHDLSLKQKQYRIEELREIYKSNHISDLEELYPNIPFREKVRLYFSK